MKLFNYWRSSCSYRVRIALHFKALPFEYVAVNLIKGEQHEGTHRSRNAVGTVPVLETNEGTLITQSVAIFEYLEQRYPEQPMLPKALEARAHVRACAEVINSGIQPLQNLGVMNHVKEQLKGDSAAWSQHWISLGLTGLEKMVQATAGRFMVGDAFSWADACLVPQLFAARRFGADVSKFPTLTRIEANCMELPAVQRSKPDQQPDAQPT